MKQFLLAFLCSSVVAAAEAPVQLQYLPHVPVMQTHTLQAEMSDALPGYKLDGEAVQSLSAVVTLKSDAPELPLTHPPFDLQFVLKDIHLELNANDVGIQVDSKTPHSPLAAQSKELINHPITLHIRPDGSLDSSSAELQKLFADMPGVKDLHLEGIWYEWFLSIFALAGKELATGNLYAIETQGGNLPKVLNYRITAIDEKEVKAELKGSLEAKVMKIEGLFALDGKQQGNIELNLSGMVQGNASWDRQNALLCQLNAHYIYTGVLKIGDSAWTLNLNLKQQLDSKPQSG